jgi:hypothetical protein
VNKLLGFALVAVLMLAPVVAQQAPTLLYWWR